METLKTLIPILIFSVVIIGVVAALPFMVKNLTEPKWPLAKSVIEAIFAGSFIGFFVGPVISIPAVIIIAFFRYKSRSEKYKNLDLKPLNNAANENKS